MGDFRGGRLVTSEEREAEITRRTRRCNELTREIDKLQRMRLGERECLWALREIRRREEQK